MVLKFFARPPTPLVIQNKKLQNFVEQNTNITYQDFSNIFNKSCNKSFRFTSIGKLITTIHFKACSYVRLLSFDRFLTLVTYDLITCCE